MPTMADQIERKRAPSERRNDPDQAKMSRTGTRGQSSRFRRSKAAEMVKKKPTSYNRLFRGEAAGKPLI